MTTITKDIAAKLAVAFVAVAMVLVAFAPSAQAQTTEELQAMINDLLAQVAALQGGAAAPVAASSVCPYTWTRDLSQGSTGADVMKLQQFLNSDPDTRVAASGAGSLGSETEYYGPATAAAVSKMQVKYRSQVLAPAGLVNPTGYFGPSSRSAANGLCVAAPTPGDDDMDDDMMDDDDDDTSGPMSLSGEASLEEFEVEDAEEDEIAEGEEDAPVAEITIEFQDGDAEISRLDLRFDNGATDIFDVLDEISLWVDGDMIASVDASDEDEYLDEDLGEIRFSGLDIFGEEDEEVEIIVAVTVQNNVDNSDLGSYDVSVDAIRFFDADGVATTEDDLFDLDGEGNGSNASFTLTEEGEDDEIIVKTSSSDPDSATLQVEDDRDSDWYTVHVFDLDTDDSENDIELNEVVVSVTVSSSTYDAIVDDAELVIDGETIDDFTVVGGGGATAVLTFDVDGDVVIDAGDRVEAELMLKFNSLDLGNEGITVLGEVTSANADAIDAEGADDLEPTSPDQLRGASQGDAHTLRTAGADISPESSSAVVTNVDNANNDYATFEIEVEVTAFEQDVYISQDPDVSISYDLVDGSGSVIIGSGATTTVVTSSADEQGAFFEITEGETETVTLQVTYEPGASQSARLRLNSVSFNDAASAPTQTQTTLPATDYRTAVVTIVD